MPEKSLPELIENWKNDHNPPISDDQLLLMQLVPAYQAAIASLEESARSNARLIEKVTALYEAASLAGQYVSAFGPSHISKAILDKLESAYKL
jgi:hypothetical protein